MVLFFPNLSTNQQGILRRRWHHFDTPKNKFNTYMTDADGKKPHHK